MLNMVFALFCFLPSEFGTYSNIFLDMLHVKKASWKWYHQIFCILYCLYPGSDGQIFLCSKLAISFHFFITSFAGLNGFWIFHTNTIAVSSCNIAW